jgi:hypothetical protein
MRSPKASALERQDRLDVARALYKSLVAQYPGRLIILHDDRGVLLARTDDNRDATAESFLSQQ